MENEYISLDELNGKKRGSSQNALESPKLAILGKFFHGMWIMVKLVGFGLGKVLKGIYGALLKLNEGMEKARQSEWGKNLQKQHQGNQSKQPMFNMQARNDAWLPQKSKKKQKNIWG